MSDTKKYLDYDGVSYLWEKIKAQLDTKAPAGAEANQNAFSNVKVKETSSASTTTTIAADAKTDTLSIEAGSNIKITPDATNDKITIAVTGIASGAEVNQNAFSNVKVGDVTIAADAKQDTLTLEAGSGVSITPDTTNDKVTIAVNSTISGLNGRVSTVEGAITTLNGTGTGSVKKIAADTAATEIAKIVNDNNNGSIDTLNEIAAWIINDTTGAAKMQADITTLKGNDGKVTSVDNHYTPTGGSAATLTAGNSTLGFGGAVVTGITLDAAKHVTGVTTSKLPSNPNTDRSVTAVGYHYAPAEDTAAALSASASTATNATGSGSAVNVVTGLKRDAKGHVVGVTSAKIYSTDNDTKVTSVSNHYTPTGGSAKTGTSGSAVSWGGAVVTGVTVDAAGHITGVTTGAIPSKPSDTDTHYTTGINAGASKTTSNTATSDPYITIKDNSTHRSQIQLKAGSNVSISSNTSGVITISSTDTNTDTKVTSADNHYTPSGSVTTTTTSGTLNFSAAVVTGVTRDSKGHVTGVTTSKLPSNPNTDTKVKQTESTGNANYPILMCTAASPTSGTAYGSYYSTGVYCNPSTKSLYATNFYTTSDRNAKTNIKEIEGSDNCPTVKQFDWKENGNKSYGFIAQELEEQGYTELVDTDDNGMKTVNYNAALSLVIGKMQAKIEELEKKILELENK